MAGLLIQYGSISAKGHGVPSILQTIESKDTGLSTRDLLVEGLASIITISTGGSAGRIGPVVEIGAGIGDLLGHRFNHPLKVYQTILGCGAAAGISAIFRAPLGGIMFVIEIMYKDIDKIKLSMIVISTITAEAVVRSISGYETIFDLPIFHLSDIREYILYIGLGVCLGFLAYITIYLLYYINKLVEKNMNLPFFTKPIIGGLIIGIIGYFIPEIMGTGIEVIPNILNLEYSLIFLVILSIMKLLATCTTLGFGGSGGIFAPSLLIGTSFGLFYGKLMQAIMPGIVLYPESYGIVGMAAIISAAARAPLTGTLIIFELTRNYSLIVPLFLASIIAEYTIGRFTEESIYSTNLFYRNID